METSFKVQGFVLRVARCAFRDLSSVVIVLVLENRIIHDYELEFFRGRGTSTKDEDDDANLATRNIQL